ncbi:hypothetical protein Acsp03_58160 [Actinomadura sp. NBRC 104412]|uniref:hypothetical protein n=1 Tax=Actinomadura sp. NBRC 104412 TaxID=3032203 RepID=UPI0024A263B7|nr:hypothetical protein [Actinomadura sp. NBRC 104412]GLZ08350.1 hypothetical protein Acsp03_58160 [Actinomadura sp. NBRC 104412]
MGLHGRVGPALRGKSSQQIIHGALDRAVPVSLDAFLQLIDRFAELLHHQRLGRRLTLQPPPPIRGRLPRQDLEAAASAAAVQVASDMFALTGTSATDERWNLHRHWRNARTHTLHDPEVWKYHHIGDWVLNRRLPPDGALF